MLISLVGKSGSGKTTVAKELKKMNPNIITIDIDLISHSILSDKIIKKELLSNFENITSDRNNEIDRKKLAALVFNNKQEMSKLEKITWPIMEKEIDKIIASNKGKIIILDWQLLPKTKYFNQSQINILVDAPVDIRIKRATTRDGISMEKFIERENASFNFDKKDFDFIIINDDERLNEKVSEVYEKSIIPGEF